MSRTRRAIPCAKPIRGRISFVLSDQTSSRGCGDARVARPRQVRRQTFAVFLGSHRGHAVLAAAGGRFVDRGLGLRSQLEELKRLREQLDSRTKLRAVQECILCESRDEEDREVRSRCPRSTGHLAAVHAARQTMSVTRRSMRLMACKRSVACKPSDASCTR